MSDYGVLHFAFWDSPSLERCDADARLLAAFLIAGRHVRTGVPGLLAGGVGTVAEGMRMDADNVADGLRQLQKVDFVEVDEKRRVIRLPNAPLYNPPHNPNMVRGWYNRWRAMPRSPLVGRHVDSIRRSIGSRDGLMAVFEETFGIEDLNRFETVAEPFDKGFETHGVSVSASVSSSGKRGAGGKGQHPDFRAFLGGFQALFSARNGGAKPTWGVQQRAAVERLLRGPGLQESLRRAQVMFTSPPAWMSGPFDLATLEKHFDKFAAAASAAPRQAGLSFDQLANLDEDPFGRSEG